MLEASRSVFELADEQIQEVEEIYKASLQAQEVPGRLQALVKNVLDNQRSALEFVAYAVVESYGDTNKLDDVYWPYASDPATFAKRVRRKLPGVTRQDILDAIERHQEFQPGQDWQAALFPLSNENKHHRLTPQTNQRLVPRPIIVSPMKRSQLFGPMVVFTDWEFVEIGAPVLATLQAIQAGVSAAASDVSNVAGL